MTTNILLSGVGGQGIITASRVLAEAAMLSGFQVKKSEIHGMSQRGGSVTSDVRFGFEVLSPMIPSGEADYLVALDSTQVVRDLWAKRDLGEFSGAISLNVPPHAVRFLKLRQTPQP